MKIYEDNEECNCVKEYFSWNKGKMIPLDIEPICKHCGSKENLKYHEPYVYKTIDEVDPGYCTCYECDEKTYRKYEREEAMKYIIMTPDEDKFCDSKNEVEEFLEEIASNFDCEDTFEDYLILKLELRTGELNAKDFKSPNNTHLVFYENEIYKIEEVIEPTVEFSGETTINW
jgi:hypothetical protein